MTAQLISAAAPVLAELGQFGDWLGSDDFRNDAGAAARLYWAILSGLTAYSAIAIFLSSIDDAFIDLYYWVYRVQRLVTRPFRKVPSLKKLHALPQKRFAVMVPAWQESDVIARMLVHTLKTMDYAQYDIFVGTYPNDPETIAEVDRVARQYPQVIRASVGHAGPTSKADCLNWVIANIAKVEEERGQKYDAILMQDSEDVIHPLSFKLVNAYLDRADMLQLPVLSMPRKWTALVACHYMDEFAEWHTKDLPVRASMTGQVPSAGVASAFSRRAIQLLCDERDNQPFNTDSLTEDYDIGQRLYEAGFKSEFVRYRAKTAVAERKARFRPGMVTTYKRQLIATREFFPDKAKFSIRQKSRWMLGISFMGWKQLGWVGPAAHRYFLYRDRKAIWTAPTGMLAYAIVFQWLLYAALVSLVPSTGGLPPLIDPNSWLWTIVQINFIFLVNRVLHRVIFTGAAHGVKYAILAPVRMVIANYIGFMACWRAGRRWVWHVMSGTRLTWDKTAHAYPSMEELQAAGAANAARARRLGDILLSWGMVGDAELEAVVAEQRRQYRPLGLALLDNALVTEDELATAFSDLTGLPRIDLDPLKTEPALLKRIPHALAARLTAYPYGKENGSIHVAIAEPITEEQRAMLEKAAGKPVKLAFAPLSDVAFGIRFGWNRAELDSDLRADRVLTQMTMLAGEESANVWKHIRRQWTRAGDLLVRRGALSHDQLMAALDRIYTTGERLGDYLRLNRIVRPVDIAALDAAQPKTPFGFVHVATRLGYLKDADLAEVAAKQPEILEDA
jgi:adsorption protein B